MEIDYSFVIGAVISFALLLGAFKLLNWVWIKPKKLEKLLQEQGLKGNPYTLLYGDFKKMKKMFKEAHSKPIGFSDPIAPRAIPLFHDAVQKYGCNTFVWFGTKPSVVIMDPENIKEITLKYMVFQKPHSNPIAKLLNQGLVSYEGDKWAKHKKLVNPAFHQDKLKHMLPAFQISAMETIRKWEAIVSPKESNEVDVWPHLQTLTSDAISRTAFGSNYEEGRRIFELQKEQLKLVLVALRTVYVPGLRFLPTKANRRMKSISKNVNDSIRSIVEKRMKAIMAGEASQDDLLGILLDSDFKENHKHEEKNSGMSIQDVIEECKLFYFAGQETTSTLLVWTMILLSKHSHWQVRAREEVLQLFGTNKPDFDGLNHMKIMTMILYEVLRLYPPVPRLDRKATQEIKLGKITLPAGVQVLLPVMLLHHDEKIWGQDALEFKPERFSEGVLHATKGQITFLPFSWGPRICIGQNFAMLEAKMAMSMILQHFSFELSPSYSHAPMSVMTLQPQHGAHLILQKI